MDKEQHNMEEKELFRITRIVEDKYETAGLSGDERHESMYADFAVDCIKEYIRQQSEKEQRNRGV